MSRSDRRTHSLGAAVVVFLSITLAACRAGGGTPIGSESASASTPASTTSAGPSASASESLGAFSCSLPVSGAATVDRAQITDIRVAAHDGYDRIVFEFAAGLPEFTIAAAAPPFTLDPSGLPLDVGGSAFLSLVMHGGTTVTPDGMLTYSGPTDFKPALPMVVELVEAGDFEAVSSWYVGLTAGPCIRVLTLADPSRLVIDIEH